MEYLFSLTLISLAGGSLDSPIVIERPHHPEWQDLTLEYSHEIAPERNVTINVSWSIVASKYSKDDNSVRLVIDLTQKWDDRRIKFRGTEVVLVPSFVQLWLPDTVVDNSLLDTVRLQSLHISPEGHVILRQRRDLEVVCRSQTDCPIVLRSFAHKGADSLDYLDNQNSAQNSTITDRIISDETLFNTLEIQLYNITGQYIYSL